MLGRERCRGKGVGGGKEGGVGERARYERQGEKGVEIRAESVWGRSHRLGVSVLVRRALGLVRAAAERASAAQIGGSGTPQLREPVGRSSSSTPTSSPSAAPAAAEQMRWKRRRRRGGVLSLPTKSQLRAVGEGAARLAVVGLPARDVRLQYVGAVARHSAVLAACPRQQRRALQRLLQKLLFGRLIRRVGARFEFALDPVDIVALALRSLGEDHQPNDYKRHRNAKDANSL
mmetsp:Transcript_56999/g.130879  ORF Transcript_56999/g.130879 Transcript_56999/m.130879 type:complete len:232 (+) Transcript_56999:10-705(+)